MEDIRKTYDGPLAMATDNMVFNLTKDDIQVRMAAIDEDIWPMPSTRPRQMDRAQKGGGIMSDFTKSGDYIMSDVLTDLWDEVNRENGTDV